MGFLNFQSLDFVQLFSANTLICESSNHLSSGPVNRSHLLLLSLCQGKAVGWVAGRVASMLAGAPCWWTVPGWHWSLHWDGLSMLLCSTEQWFPSFTGYTLHLSGEEEHLALVLLCLWGGSEVTKKAYIRAGHWSPFLLWKVTFGSWGPGEAAWSAPLQTSFSFLTGQVLESQSKYAGGQKVYSCEYTKVYSYIMG